MCQYVRFCVKRAQKSRVCSYGFKLLNQASVVVSLFWGAFSIIL